MSSGYRSPFADPAEHRADREAHPLLGDDLGQGSGRRRRDFDIDLVGFELDQRLVDGDRLTRMLEPFRDRRLGDQLAEARHLDLDCHCRGPSAVTRRARR